MIDDLLLKIKNRKLVVMLAPVIVGVFLGGIIVVKPSLARLVAIRAESSLLSKKEAVFGRVIEQEKKLSECRQHLSRILDKAKFIEELNNLANQSGLTVLSMVPDEKRTVVVYLEKIGVRIEAEGNYHQLGEFVSRVENLDQFAQIVLADINTETGTDSTVSPTAKKGNVYKISLVVGLFYPVKDVF